MTSTLFTSYTSSFSQLLHSLTSYSHFVELISVGQYRVVIFDIYRRRSLVCKHVSRDPSLIDKKRKELYTIISVLSCNLL